MQSENQNKLANYMQQAQDIDGVINVSLVYNKTNNSNNQIQAIQIKCSEIMNLVDRHFMKNNAAIAAATAAGMTIPTIDVKASDATIKWDKAPCRFLWHWLWRISRN